MQSNQKIYFLYTIISRHLLLKINEGCPRGVLVKPLDYRIVLSDFELQSCYYMHFRTNTLGKGIDTLVLPSMA